MKSVIQKLVWLLTPAILFRAAALSLSDVFSAMMAVDLGKLISAATEQRMLTSGDAAVFGVLFLVAAVVCPVLLFFSNKMIFRISMKSEEALFRDVLNQNPTRFEEMDAGEVSSKLVDDGIQLRWALIDFFVGLLDAVLMLAILGWFLVHISVPYTMIILILVVFSYGKSLLFGSALAKEDVNVLKAAQPVKAKMLEAAASIHFLSINKLTPIFRGLLEKEIEIYSNHALKRSLSIRTVLKGVSEFWDNSSQLIILFSGAYLAHTGLIHIGTVLTMSSYYVLLAKQFSNLDKIMQSKRLIRELTEDISFALDQPFEPIPCDFSTMTVLPFCYQMREKAIHCPIEMTLRKGEKVAITGENGVGKTTLLHLLIGLRECDKITVCLDGTPCGKGNLRWLVSYVDMNANSLGDTVDRYVLSGESVSGMIESDGVLEKIKQQCGLCSIWKQNTDTLSGGQRKHVDLARSLIEERQILALDEPEVGLDRHWKRSVSDMIKRADQTVIFTTHDPDFMAAADKIIFIDDGEMVSVQYPKETSRKP